MCGWASGWIWIWPVLILMGLLMVGYLVARRPRGRVPSSLPGSSPARLILDERYARGEIEEEEYRRRRVELW